ncbi:MAG: 3-deoxy-7-phosphoheptulonate synthase [Polyangiales bacterium]
MNDPRFIFNTDDLRIDRLRPLLPPAILMDELPITERAAELVARTRDEAAGIVRGKDDRLLVIVGPCSIHDPKAAIEYGERLLPHIDRLGDDLCIIMRVYFEKPRTTVGWKGLINDPNLDGSFEINKGLRLARGVLLDLVDRGIPAGTEFLDTITPQYIADLVSWGAIGARTTESQVHRELASGLSMPVGFKNGTAGSIQIAVDAIRAARNPHHFLSVTKQGISAIVATRGNDTCHLILRGGHGKPNYDAASVAEATTRLDDAGLDCGIVIDMSHANSSKDHDRQATVANDVATQIAAGSRRIAGVMIESHLVGGRQDLAPGKPLAYGQSITDGCLAWDKTVPVLDALAAAVRKRRFSQPTQV